MSIWKKLFRVDTPNRKAPYISKAFPKWGKISIQHDDFPDEDHFQQFWSTTSRLIEQHQFEDKSYHGCLNVDVLFKTGRDLRIFMTQFSALLTKFKSKKQLPNGWSTCQHGCHCYMWHSDWSNDQITNGVCEECARVQP